LPPHIAVPLLLLLALSTGLVAFYGRAPARYEDCANPAELFDPYRISVESRYRGSIQSDQTPLDRRLDGFVARQSKRDSLLAFSLRRSYSVPSWMLRPTLSVPGPREPDHFETVDLAVAGQTIPVRFGYSATTSSIEFTGYFFAHEHESISSPVAARILGASRAFTSGVRPITLFAISGSAHRARAEHEQERAREWLAAAWTHYRSVCGN
jgi:hypothetical protein